MTSERPLPGDGTTSRHVTVEGVRLRFAAAHMATLGDELEPLHGHNYEVRCRVDGELTDDRWVIDFSVLKRLAREACEALDHRFLLQERSPHLQVTREGEEWVIAHGERRYRFPTSDVRALPIENTTAELLAEWIWRRVASVLDSGGHANLVRLSVDVEEMPGQAGGYSAVLGGSPR
jgi:6-pyruvoyltetrahydropterin/6-carboxytetrahydropterin synthase